MKTKLVALLLVCVALAAHAGSWTYECATVMTGGTQVVVSDDIPIGGVYLDRVNVWNTDPKGTSVVVIANYVGTTIADVIYSGTVANASAATARPRRVGTTSAGVALSVTETVVGTPSNAVVTTGGSYYSVPYEKVLLSGNIKVRSVELGATVVTNYPHVQFIYD